MLEPAWIASALLLLSACGGTIADDHTNEATEGDDDPAAAPVSPPRPSAQCKLAAERVSRRDKECIPSLTEVRLGYDDCDQAMVDRLTKMAECHEASDCAAIRGDDDEAAARLAACFGAERSTNF